MLVRCDPRGGRWKSRDAVVVGVSERKRGQVVPVLWRREMPSVGDNALVSCLEYGMESTAAARRVRFCEEGKREGRKDGSVK